MSWVSTRTRQYKRDAQPSLLVGIVGSVGELRGEGNNVFPYFSS